MKLPKLSRFYYILYIVLMVSILSLMTYIKTQMTDIQDGFEQTKSYVIKQSEVHGQGLFANKDISKGETIELTIKMPSREVTPYFGSMINHSKTRNNTKLTLINDDYYLEATNLIPKGKEIFINYDGSDIPDFVNGSEPHYV